MGAPSPSCFTTAADASGPCCRYASLPLVLPRHLVANPSRYTLILAARCRLPVAHRPRRQLSFLSSLDTQRFQTMASTKVQRVMTQPINLIFRFLQSKARIQIWLFEQKDLRIEGRIIGFDEYMNLVLDDAEEVNVKKNTRKTLGRILLKGDNITLMMNTGK
ncbi:Small nuclear ribonucleoprotein E [Arachis hypogaea]|nr:Small nuclear ribonucleoprotein E [Arachis hypogaea]